MKKKLFILIIVCSLGLLFLAIPKIVLLFLHSGMSTGSKKTFEIFLKKPIPSDVAIIRGETVGFQDHVSYLIFKTSESTFIEIAQSFVPITLDKNFWTSHKSDFDSLFKLNLSEIPHLESYLKKENHSKSYLFWDSQNQTVYFYSSDW